MVQMIFFLLLSSCVSPGTAPEFFLAEQGQWTVDPDSLCDSLPCRFDEVDEIVGIYPEVEGVVEVSELSPTLFTLKALTAGDTLVAISGLDSGRDLVERYMRVTVAAVNKFKFGIECDAQEPAMDPWILPTDSEVSVRWNMWDVSSNPLQAWPEFIAEGITFIEENQSNRSMVFLLPDEEGEIDVGSPLSPGPVASLQVVSKEQFTEFEAYFWPDTPLPINQSRRMKSAPSVDGHRVCVDPLQRIATITTPDVCSFRLGGHLLEAEDSGDHLDVMGTAPGLCSVEVSVPELEWTETISLSIVN